MEVGIPEPVDPYEPIAIGDAIYLANMANTDGIQIESVILSEDASYVTITSGAGGDPNFWILPHYPAITGVRYVALMYRTTAAGTSGEFFIGSQSITGGYDELRFDYIADGEWHVLILDISTVEAIDDTGLVNYLRYDFFLRDEYASIDIANIGFFGSYEAACAYYGIS